MPEVPPRAVGAVSEGTPPLAFSAASLRLRTASRLPRGPGYTALATA